jgi:hypothetical protein
MYESAVFRKHSKVSCYIPADILNCTLVHIPSPCCLSTLQEVSSAGRAGEAPGASHLRLRSTVFGVLSAKKVSGKEYISHAARFDDKEQRMGPKNIAPSNW